MTEFFNFGITQDLAAVFPERVALVIMSTTVLAALIVAHFSKGVYHFCNFLSYKA